MKRKLGLAILSFPPLLAAIAETRVSIGHYLRDPWPPHAMFHLFMGQGALLAACGLALNWPGRTSGVRKGA